MGCASIRQPPRIAVSPSHALAFETMRRKKRTILTLRSIAQRCVSKGGPQPDCIPPFETRSCGPLLRMRHFFARTAYPTVTGEKSTYQLFGWT